MDTQKISPTRRSTRILSLVAVGAAALLVSMLGAGAASAVAIGSPSPIPLQFAPDDGTELFLPDGAVLSTEIFDAIGSFTDSTFGFYFASDPSTLIPIFEATDIAPPSQSAAIDFGTGTVVDADLGALQNIFTPQAGAIGFYLDTPLTGTIFSEGALNAGGDQVGTYAFLTDDQVYLLGFETPDGTKLALEIVSGLTAVRPGALVPEPAAAASFGVGMLIFGAAVRRRKA